MNDKFEKSKAIAKCGKGPNSVVPHFFDKRNDFCDEVGRRLQKHVGRHTLYATNAFSSALSGVDVPIAGDIDAVAELTNFIRRSSDVL